jgi:hypothetical protein
MAPKTATHPTPVTDFALATTGPVRNAADMAALINQLADRVRAARDDNGFDPNGNVLTTG